jgi:hypothetical protein
MDQRDLVEAVRSLVDAGEYRDELLLLPGARTDGGGMFAETAKGRQRMVDRGSPEHLQAQINGEVDPLPLLTPAGAEAVDEAEGRLGRRLPEPLRTLFLEVGNGSFGPGYGVLGLAGGHRDSGGQTAVDMLGLHARPPAVLWPLCHWGCGIYSLVDCASPDATIWGFDPNPAGDVPEALFPEDLTLTVWFERWITRRLYQPCLDRADDGTLRPLTQDELEQMFTDSDTW